MRETTHRRPRGGPRRWAVALAGLLLLPAAPASSDAPEPLPPHPPSPLAGLPTDVAQGQVVTLGDGDRYEVTGHRRGRSIRGRRWDAATGTWGPAQVLFHQPGLRCWGVRARGAGTGVAITMGCGPAFVTDWSGHPHAIVSSDTRHWQWRRLPGYGWSAPGVSPDGTRAVWSRLDDYLTWAPGTGFVQRPAAPPAHSYEDSEAPMITDAGDVSVAYAGDDCTVFLHDYPALGAPVRQAVPLGDDCAFPDPHAVDADTVVAGDLADPWSAVRLARPGPGAPWALTAPAPLYAPGLRRDHFSPDTAPMLLDAPGRPLAVAGNARDLLRVQLYDPAAAAWGPPAPVLSRPGGTRCRFRDDLTPVVGYFALALRCAGPDRLLTSRDGGRWRALRQRTQVTAANHDLDLVVAADRRHSVVLDPPDGAPRTLPVGTAGGCDVLYPVAADRLLRVTATPGSRGWPELLQRSTPRGWRTVRRVAMRHHGACRRVYPGPLSGRGATVAGPTQSLLVRFVHRHGRWDVRVR